MYLESLEKINLIKNQFCNNFKQFCGALDDTVPVTENFMRTLCDKQTSDGSSRVLFQNFLTNAQAVSVNANELLKVELAARQEKLLDLEKLERKLAAVNAEVKKIKESTGKVKCNNEPEMQVLEDLRNTVKAYKRSTRTNFMYHDADVTGYMCSVKRNKFDVFNYSLSQFNEDSIKCKLWQQLEKISEEDYNSILAEDNIE